MQHTPRVVALVVAAMTLCAVAHLAAGATVPVRIATATWNVGDQANLSAEDVGVLYSSLTKPSPHLVVVSVQECFDFGLPAKFEKASGGEYVLVVQRSSDSGMRGRPFPLVPSESSASESSRVSADRDLSSLAGVTPLLWSSNKGNRVHLAKESSLEGRVVGRDFPARGGESRLSPHGMTGVMVFRRKDVAATMVGAIDVDMSTWKTAASKGAVAAVVRVEPLEVPREETRRDAGAECSSGAECKSAACSEQGVCGSIEDEDEDWEEIDDSGPPAGGEPSYVVAISCHLPSGESRKAEMGRLSRIREISEQVDRSLRDWYIKSVSAVVWAGDFNSRTTMDFPSSVAAEDADRSSKAYLSTRELMFVEFVEKLRRSFGTAYLRDGVILQNPRFAPFESDTSSRRVGTVFTLADQLSKPEARGTLAECGYTEAGPLAFPPTCFKIKHTPTEVHGLLGGRDNQRHMLCREATAQHCFVNPKLLASPCNKGACYTFRSGKQSHDDQASIPGYCDRVLVKTPPGWTHETLAYGSVYGLGSSDHAPVVALIDLIPGGGADDMRIGGRRNAFGSREDQDDAERSYHVPQ